MKNIILLVFLSLIVDSALSQTDFTKIPSEPVVPRTPSFGEWDAIATSDPHVIEYNDTLHMWYTGVGWLTTADTSVHQRIGYAWSLDGVNWNKYVNNPVLDRTLLAWDDLGVETPCVIVDSTAPPSERFKMWYAGQNSATEIYDIGYAVSDDGINWTKSSGSVLQIGASSSWENSYLEGPSVVLQNDTLRMWYASVDLVGDGQPTDFTGNIGYAWSLDGVNWNKHANNPVFTSYNSSGWDLASVADPHVIYNNGQFQMWYAGLNTWTNENFKMGYAYSSDGINWIRPTSTPVLETGDNGEWDEEDASYGCVIYDNTTDSYEMWYTGIDTNYPSSDLNAYHYEIGHAVSPNSVSLNSFSSNEVKIQVFPNPTQEEVTVIGNKEELQKIEVVNTLGENVIDVISVDYKDHNKITINMGSLESGLYIIRTKTTVNKVYKQ